MRGIIRLSCFIGLLAALSCLATGCIIVADNEWESTRATHEGGRDGMMIHVSSGSNAPQKALMALKMADLMSPERPTLVYFDNAGVEVAVAGEAPLNQSEYGSSRDLIESLKTANVQMYACPTCLKAHGYSEDQLLDGIKIADKDAFFNFTNGRIITLDY